MKEKYFHLQTMTEEPALGAKAWQERFFRAHPCFHWDAKRPPDVSLAHPGENVALTFVDPMGVRLVRVDLLEVLGDSVNDCLILGNVHDEHGNIINHYRTIGAERTLEIRGGPKSTRQFCKICRRFLYYPIVDPCVLGQGSILESNLTGRPLYYPSVGSLVINDTLYARFCARTWPNIEVRQLTVLDKPEDDLPDDLSEVRIGSFPVHVGDLVCLVGWRRRPLMELRELLKPLVQKHGEEVIDGATAELFEVDPDCTPRVVQLTQRGKEIVREILGPPPRHEIGDGQ